MNIDRILVKPDPTGTFTITVTGWNKSGGYVIGHCGGVPRNQTAKAVTLVADLLNSAQANVATLYADQKASL